jgi:hypothetical protein
MPKWTIYLGMQEPRSHEDLISALGGPVQLARGLGIYKAIPTTLHWRTRGIPSRYWHRVAELAVAASIRVTPHDLERLPVQTPSSAA